ncbi:MAG: hypothetical protein QMC37_03795, partial [Flavobacteriales bacterium]
MVDTIVIATIDLAFSGTPSLSVDFFSNLQKRIEIAHEANDLLECKTMELGYRLAALVTSLLSPLLDLDPTYRKDYIVTGATSDTWRQPRALEAALSTLLVGANPLFFYGAHQIADLQRAVLSIFDVVFSQIEKAPDYKIVDAGDLLELAVSYRYTVPLLVMRNTVLAGRDFMISILMFFQVVLQMIPDNSYDGQLFSKSIRLLTDLAQELVAFFTESFMKAIESLVELFLMFIKAVWEAKPEDMRNFFVKLFDTMLYVILEFAKGLL